MESKRKSSKKSDNNVYFPRGNTYIKVSNNNLLIINKNTLDKDTFALRVCNGFYIELGRPLSDYKTVLMEIDVPIVFERIVAIFGYVHYNIVRMATDNVEDLILGTLICKDGIIEKITCDSSYKTRNDFNKYDRIGAIWQGGSFERTDSPLKNQENAKNITMSLMSLNMYTADTTITGLGDDLLFSPIAIHNNSELEDVRNKIRKDNIETEFDSGDAESAYELVQDELEEETDTEDSFDKLADSLEDNKFTTVDRFKIAGADIDEEAETTSLSFGDIKIDTTYSVVKIEVTVSDVDSKTYKFSFILNEVSRMYELVSIAVI